jgi:hypothetical protein
MVRRHELDLDAALLDARVLDRHFRRNHRPRACDIGVETRHVGQHADLDDAVRDLRLRQPKYAGEREGETTAGDRFHGFLRL